jgi:hypothetical protein
MEGGFKAKNRKVTTWQKLTRIIVECAHHPKDSKFNNVLQILYVLSIIVACGVAKIVFDPVFLPNLACAPWQLHAAPQPAPGIQNESKVYCRQDRLQLTITRVVVSCVCARARASCVVRCLSGARQHINAFEAQLSAS